MVDANVLISGAVWPRWPYELLHHAIAGDFQLVLSPLVIEEARRRVEASFADHAWRLADTLTLTAYEEAPNPTKAEVEAHANLVRDQADIPVALAAIKAGVDVLISRDRDLTDRDESTEKLRQQLNILLPGTFLRKHMGWTSGELEAIRNRTWDDFADDEDGDNGGGRLRPL